MVLLLLLLLLLLRKRTCNHNKLSVLRKDAWSANIYSQSWSISVPVAHELMNSLMRKWFCLFIQKSIHKMNNPIFVFSLDSIIECWFDYCFLKNYTFHKLTSEFCFFLFFSESRVRASSEVQTQTNCYMYAILLPVIRVTRWSNCGQCMCGDWWISILGFCQFTQS